MSAETDEVRGVVKHDPHLSYDEREGFRVVCPCGYRSAPSGTAGGGRVTCIASLFEGSGGG